jgi:quinol monooxygenase YgiN
MILRLFHVTVRSGKHEQFRKTIEFLILPYAQSRNGLLACYPGQPAKSDSNQFVLVTVWKDDTVFKNSTPKEWINAIIPEESLPLIEEWHIDHYKSFGIKEHTLKPMFQSL